MNKFRYLIALSLIVLFGTTEGCKPRVDSDVASSASVGVSPTWWKDLKKDLVDSSSNTQALEMSLRKMNTLVVYAKNHPNAPALQNQVTETQALGTQVNSVLDTLLKRLDEIEKALAAGASPNPNNEVLRQVPKNRTVNIDGEDQDWGVEGVKNEVTKVSDFVQENLYNKTDTLVMKDTSQASMDEAANNIAQFSIDLDNVRFWLDDIKTRTESWFDANAADAEGCGSLTAATSPGDFFTSSCTFFPAEAFLHFMDTNSRPCDKGPEADRPGTAITPANLTYYNTCKVQHAKIKANLQKALTDLGKLNGQDIWGGGNTSHEMNELGPALKTSPMTLRVVSSGTFDYQPTGNTFTIPFRFQNDSMAPELIRLFSVRPKPSPPPPPVVIPPPPPVIPPAPTCAITLTPNSIQNGATSEMRVTGTGIINQAFVTDSVANLMTPVTLPLTTNINPTSSRDVTCVVQNNGGKNQATAKITVITQVTPPPVLPPPPPPAPTCSVTLTPNSVVEGTKITIDIVKTGGGDVDSARLYDTETKVFTAIKLPYHQEFLPPSTRGIFCFVKNAGGENNTGAPVIVTPKAPVVIPQAPPTAPQADMIRYAYVGPRPLMKPQKAYSAAGHGPVWVSAGKDANPMEWKVATIIKIFAQDPVWPQNNVDLIPMTVCLFQDPAMNGNNLLFLSTAGDTACPQNNQQRTLPANRGGLIGFVYAHNSKPGLVPLYRCKYPAISTANLNEAACGGKQNTRILGFVPQQ